MLACVVVAGVVSTGLAAATEPQAIACDATALAHAFEVGGTYVFGANCELMLGTELTLHTATTLTLESGDHHVAFVGTDAGSPYWAGNANRFATVDGHLTLEGIDVKRFAVGGTTLDGTPGSAGGEGEHSSGFNVPGGNGTDHGGNGGDGGHGGDGRDAHGGAMLIDGTGVVNLEVTEFTEDYSDGGRGGAGGAGGAGGETAGVNQNKEMDLQPGGNGGNGGEGGRGGDAYGGAIENDGTLIVNLSSFKLDIAVGGTSVGGSGGEGGRGFDRLGGLGGLGGAAGRTGSAFGGAIYNTGTLTVANTEFISDYAGYDVTSFSGNGGRGGQGGERGGRGGDGAAPGPVGLVAGGDVYSDSAFTVSGGFANGVARAAESSGGGGGRGGAACGRQNETPESGCATNGVNGSPAPGTAPPVARGQTGGETFVPTPSAGSGGGEPNPGGGSGGGSGGGETGGSGSGGNGSTGNGSGSTGTGGSGAGSGSSSGSGSGSGAGGNGSGSGAGGNGSGSGAGGAGGGHAVLGKITDSGKTTSVPVECPASGTSCAITAELTTSGGASGDAIGSLRRLLKATVLGRATVTVHPGHSTSLKVRLGAGGRRLLADRRRLVAHLMVLQKVGGRQTVLRSTTVTFKAHG